MILVECKPDEILVRSPFPNISNKVISHCKNKTEIIKRLVKSERGKRSLGLIDQDPDSRPPGYFSLFQEINRLNYENLIILQADNGSTLIQLEPRLEEWIIRLSQIEKIDLSKYNLSSDPNTFHRHVNANLTKFSKLIDDLISQNKIMTSLKIEIEKILTSLNGED